MNRTHTLSRRMRTLAVLLSVGLGTTLLASTAAAGTTASCGKQVVADWYDNGRIDRLYKLSCYREAIRIIPVDVRDYSNAIEEITRALQYAKRGKRAPAKPIKPRAGTGTSQTTTSGTAPGAGTGSGSGSGTGTGKAMRPPGSGTTSIDTGTTSSTGAAFTDAGGNIDTSGPSSVPVPLIVLGGLAVLLLAAGSAGYLSRRLNARRGNGSGPPPSSA